MRKLVQELIVFGVVFLGFVTLGAIGGESYASNNNFTATNSSNTNTNATSTGGVSVVSHKLIEEFPGSFSLIGEIRNDYPDRKIGLTFIDAKFYDSTGQLLHIERGLSSFDGVQPGQRAPFTISITDQSITDKIANYSLTAEQDSTPLGDKPAVLRVEITSQNMTEQAPSGPQYKVIGRVINTGSEPATDTSVLATFYDSTGKMIDYESISTVSPSTIPPGQSADFIINASVGNYSNRTAETQSIASVDVIALSSEYLSILEP